VAAIVDAMNVKQIKTRPFTDQKPGTSGLRKKVRVFEQPHYLENFVQSVFDAMPDGERNTLVVGGDGRYHNATAANTIVRMAAANGFRKVIVGQNALLSTPAASCVIRTRNSNGGIVLSASHNPGGPTEDFGIKFNNAAGAPAPESVTGAIFERSTNIDTYRLADMDDLDITAIGKQQFAETEVEVIDPVAEYADLMAQCFDFDALRTGFESGRLSIAFDAMHAITGPYARHILEERLGASPGSVMNGTPLEDFGGGHPDPNLAHAQELVALMNTSDAPVLGAASDGDGDRNLIHGPGFFVTPSDSLALIARHAAHIPQFKNGLAGVARSMPTSAAVDRVAQKLGIECFVTPTGWKFFGNLLDAGKIRLCGEESFGTGGDHVREKDGLWTVLAWLSIVGATGKSVGDLVREHWAEFGRNYYCRYDYEAVTSEDANTLMQELSAKLDALGGQTVDELEIERADSFSYIDPVDGSRTDNQGIQVHFAGGSRFALRLSGTGTEGATIRLYLERFEPASGELGLNAVEATVDLAKAADAIAGITQHTGRDAPTVIT